MPTYPSAEALLADAGLRLDRLGSGIGVLVVEGPDDKRLFGPRCLHSQQVIASGGKPLLLAAHAAARAQGLEGVVFVTDCDHDVLLDRLRPHPTLIVTEYADVEADLAQLDGLRQLVNEFVPAALNSDDDLHRLTAELFTRSVAFAEPLGQLRLLANREGFKINTSAIRHRKYRPRRSNDVDVGAMARVVIQNSDECSISFEECWDRVNTGPKGYALCNGHDLLSAAAYVLHEDFGMETRSGQDLAVILRSGLQPSSAERWSVVRRLRRWEQTTQRRLLT